MGFALLLFRTVIVASDAAGVGAFSGYFFVLGQINRQGWDFTVSLKYAMLRPIGSTSRMSDFSFSEEARKF